MEGSYPNNIDFDAPSNHHFLARNKYKHETTKPYLQYND